MTIHGASLCIYFNLGYRMEEIYLSGSLGLDRVNIWVYPLHASIVGLIRNLNTNHMSPYFHVVYGNIFQTVHSDEGNPPA